MHQTGLLRVLDGCGTRGFGACTGYDPLSVLYLYPPIAIPNHGDEDKDSTNEDTAQTVYIYFQHHE
jgi:hypothetical protein